MSSDSKGDDLLGSLKNEIVKVKKVYDGSDRLVTQYEALANTVANGPCLETTYTYVGATTRVDKMREAVGVWLAAYDI
jgi:hypothetical protein